MDFLWSIYAAELFVLKMVVDGEVDNFSFFPTLYSPRQTDDLSPPLHPILGVANDCLNAQEGKRGILLHVPFLFAEK